MDMNLQAAIDLAMCLLNHVEILSLKTIKKYEVYLVSLSNCSLNTIAACTISGNFWSPLLIIGEKVKLDFNKHQILKDKSVNF